MIFGGGGGGVPSSSQYNQVIGGNRTLMPLVSSSQLSDNLLVQIEQRYMEGDYDECLQLIDRRFIGLRSHFQPASQSGENKYTGQARQLHACHRNAACDCNMLTSYLLAIAFHRGESDVAAFLVTGGFLHEPEIRMPFDSFVEWLQLEIHRSNYKKADELLRQYIYESTRLKTEEDRIGGNETSQQSYYRGMFGGMRRGGGGLLGSGGLSLNAKDLPLSRDQYYELLELLVFYILLPSVGYENTRQELMRLPMPKDVREAFEQRLLDIRNTAVADLKITNSEQLLPSQTLASATTSATSSHRNSTTEAVQSHIPQTVATSPEKQAKPSQYFTLAKIRKALLLLAVLVILYYMAKSGLLRKIIVDFIWRSRLVQWLLLVLFNYRAAVAK